MDNKEMNTPIITSLVVDNEPPDPDELTEPTPTPPPWNAPFLELLGLLEITDKSQPTLRLDHLRFCFQPSPDFSEISRIFLSVSTSDLQYDIDLKAIRLMGSDAVPSAVTKLQEYANNVLRKFRQFKDCLLQRDVVNDPTCFLRVDMSTCPVCLDPLNDCLECDAVVACSNENCLAALIVDCEQCFPHRRMVCYDCLKKNDTVAPLIYCPTCQGWCCREDSSWCPGLVVQPTPGSKELAELSRASDWDNDAIVRSHPPKPSPCKFCTENGFARYWWMCRNSMIGKEPDRCPSKTPSMLDHRLYAAYCPDCHEQNLGRNCACGASWLCDMCFAVGNKSIDYPHFIVCPRCGVGYCTNPDLWCLGYVGLCRGCKGVPLCNDCQEEEEVPGDAQRAQDVPKLVVLSDQCIICDSWNCADCSIAEGTARCVHCNEWLCDRCIADADVGEMLQPCSLCGGIVCHICREERRGCSGATMLGPVLPPYLYTTPANLGSGCAGS